MFSSIYKSGFQVECVKCGGKRGECATGLELLLYGARILVVHDYNYCFTGQEFLLNWARILEVLG